MEPLDGGVRPWRTATLVASAIAVLELVALVAAGLVLLAKPLARHVRAVAVRRVLAPPAQRPPAPPRALQSAPGALPRLPRSETSVLVLNGSGRRGAAADSAARVQALGYLIAGVGNAPRGGPTQTLVMYRPGYRAEAERLARDLRAKIVGPLDGLRLPDLQGAHLALLVGR